jgi:hypothetical protein
LRSIPPKSSVLVCIFHGKKRFNAKDTCLWWEVFVGRAVHKWFQKHDKRFAEDKEVEMEVQKCLRQHSKEFYAVGFDALIIQCDNCVNVGEGYVKK